jgi:hypothetical protein
MDINQSTASVSAPSPGDVLFHCGGKKERLKSGSGQLVIDKKARTGLWDRTTQWFTHVSLVIRNSLVLEAMPSGGASDPVDEFREGGVRLRTLERHLLELADADEGFSVLRSPQARARDADVFHLDSLDLVSIIGSGYSIKHLVDPKYMELLTKLTSAPSEWSATNTNLLTGTEISVEFLSALKQKYGYEFPFQAREFFCSELVAFLLKKADLVSSDLRDTITPTGLWQTLLESGWNDVTKIAYTGELAEGNSDRLRHLRAILRTGANQTLAMRDELAKMISMQLDDLDELWDRFHEEITYQPAERDPLRERILLLVYVKLIEQKAVLLNTIISLKSVELDGELGRLFTTGIL